MRVSKIFLMFGLISVIGNSCDKSKYTDVDYFYPISCVVRNQSSDKMDIVGYMTEGKKREALSLLAGEERKFSDDDYRFSDLQFDSLILSNSSQTIFIERTPDSVKFIPLSLYEQLHSTKVSDGEYLHTFTFTDTTFALIAREMMTVRGSDVWREK